MYAIVDCDFGVAGKKGYFDFALCQMVHKNIPDVCAKQTTG